ncbi:DUF58 domain-containing protein [Xanthobacter agilis]|jgi:uncharacterized protein (DUF58 family)|uniref:Uncharacterized protein (DUF58 family) n=1 Tax=Xanthobacter agilis TaxID=47492 RepID=A0ABU0LF72_XANAG|nr:DUF58 domain-containing protein [Xanthobacter agilis]MDQ0505786.1 uncharacterized protein (DUF58 family) [Xanthobacter agilis]
MPPETTTDPLYGLVASLEELVAVRPGDGVGGFAPGGKVRTHQFGGHRSSFRGRGMEFDEVRAYQPGDDIRTIDWRVTARTGKAHTKLFQEERERPVLLLVDARRSMRFGTRDCFKSVLAARAAAVLTWVAIAGGDRVGGVVLTPFGLSAFRPERSRRRILHFVKAVAQATAEGFGQEGEGAEPTLAEALARLRGAARPGTLVFLASDFADFNAAAARELNRLSHASQVTAIFTYDPLEARLPPRGSYRISDGAAVARLDMGRGDVAAAYAERFAARRARIELFCRPHGMAFVPLETGQDAADLLHPERLGPGRASRRGVA